MKTDGILLDVDGTLWDSREVVAAAWNRAMERAGARGEPVTAERLAGLFGKPMNVIADELFPGVEGAARERLLAECCAEEDALLEQDGRVLDYPGVRGTIRALAARVRLFIVSNCQSGYIERFLAKTGLAPYVTGFLCYGDTGRGKAENIRAVAERYGIAAPVYVGDTDGDRAASEAAGVPFVWAEYGFGTAERYAAKIGAFAELPALFGLDGKI